MLLQEQEIIIIKKNNKLAGKSRNIVRSLMNLDPIDFFPGYDPCSCVGRSRYPQETHSNFWTNCVAVIVAVALCSAGLCYYEIAGKDVIENLKNSIDSTKNKKCVQDEILTNIKKEIRSLKHKIDKAEEWKKQLDNLYTKIYVQQESTVEKKILEILEVYDSDKIGLFDYAALYASGSVISIPHTIPYPVNKTINIFSLLQFNILSNPETILQPNNFPGNCFAFHGSTGRIRIKLGRKIAIKAVTVDHSKLYEDWRSAPKDFEVYGLLHPEDTAPEMLGKFTYKLKGRSYQTFTISKNDSKQFEYVELRILSNYGRAEFTCVYRFRVHNNFIGDN